MSIQFDDEIKTPFIEPRPRSMSYTKCPMPMRASEKEAEELFNIFKEKVWSAVYPGKSGILKEVNRLQQNQNISKTYINTDSSSPIQKVVVSIYKSRGCLCSEKEVHIAISFPTEPIDFYAYLVKEEFPVTGGNAEKGYYQETHPDNVKRLLEMIKKYNRFSSNPLK
ncbi:MAG: hypothetical protein KGJ02_00440 [Verrucomicrobiota bacterium]|nr:hypothetical protein [Verrucomicrobiota bacterium]